VFTLRTGIRITRNDDDDSRVPYIGAGAIDAEIARSHAWNKLEVDLDLFSSPIVTFQFTYEELSTYTCTAKNETTANTTAIVSTAPLYTKIEHNVW